MIQSHSSKKHSQQDIIAACQGRSSLNARQRLCAESDYRTSTTSLKQFLQAHSFCLSWWQCSMASKGLPRTHLCCVPGLSPTCSHCSCLLEQPQSCGSCLWAQQPPKKGCAMPTRLPLHSSSDLPVCTLAGPRHLLPLWKSLPFFSISLSWCSWSQFYCATFESSWAICFHSPTFFSLSVFILLTPEPHSLHMACPSF